MKKIVVFTGAGIRNPLTHIRARAAEGVPQTVRMLCEKYALQSL